MSLRIIKKQNCLIAILTIIFLLGYFVNYLFVNFNLSSPVIQASQNNAFMPAVSKKPSNYHLLAKKSKFFSNCIHFNHYSSCKILIPDIRFDLVLLPHREPYFSYNFAPQYKECIPELKPPRIA